MKQIHIRIINHSSCFVHNFFSFFRKWDERSVPAFLFQTFETLVTLITAEILSPLSILSIVPAFTYFNPLIPYNCLYLVRYC